jgi:hypothetical protein
LSEPIFIEAYDPGNATGYVMGSFSDTEPFRPHKMVTLEPPEVYRMVAQEWPLAPNRIRIVESFRLRSSNEFSARLKGVGLIEVMRFGEYIHNTMDPIIWQTRGDKALIKDEVLRKSGLWRTGKQVGWNTGRHVNDASIHILAYLFKQRHEPTLKLYGL